MGLFIPALFYYPERSAHVNRRTEETNHRNAT
nr:MAG TPA: hypothetical protein [Caudoviricetes sp.]